LGRGYFAVSSTAAETKLQEYMKSRSIRLPCSHVVTEVEDEDGTVYLEEGYTGMCPVCSIKYHTDEFGKIVEDKSLLHRSAMRSTTQYYEVST
jgi:hypothetical protein